MLITKEENCYRIVENIGKLVDINFDINQIDIAHRNRQNLNANTPTLIVLFKSRTSRDNFYYNIQITLKINCRQTRDKCKSLFLLHCEWYNICPKMKP